MIIKTINPYVAPECSILQIQSDTIISASLKPLEDNGGIISWEE